MKNGATPHAEGALLPAVRETLRNGARIGPGTISPKRLLLALAAGASLFHACGVGDGATKGQDRSEPSASSTTATPWTHVEVGVASVDRVVDDLHLAVTTEPVPTADGVGDCAIELVDATQKDNIVDAHTTPSVEVRARRSDGSAWSPEFSGTFAGCDLAPRTITVALSAPLRGRAVAVRIPYSLWLPQPDGGFLRCALPACDPQTGEAPDPDGCDRTLTDAVRAQDLPRRTGVDVKACRGGFAVVDVDLGASACPATGDGEPNPCAGERVDRMFLGRAQAGWALIAYGRRGAAGCGQANLPGSFPSDLCEGLPPAS